MSVLAAGVAAIVPASLGDSPRAPIKSPRGTVHSAPSTAHSRRLDLPARITIEAGRFSYVVERDGQVRRLPGTQGQAASAPGTTEFPGTGTWFRIQQGHLIIGRAGTSRVWRSREEISSAQLGVVMLGRHAVAFQHDHKLYLASLNGPERPVAWRELPLGWSARGLYTYRYRDRALVLRSVTGALIKSIAHRPLGSDYFVADGSLYFIAHGALMRARGTRTSRLASLAQLGVSADAALEPVERLAELEDDQRLVVVRPNGTVYASARLREWRWGGLSSSLVVAPRSRAVAFTATNQRRGTETVYVLRPGARSPLALHTESVRFKPCEGGAILQWRGSWIVYSDLEGKLAAIDTAGARRVVELSGLARRLPGTGTGFGAHWTGHPLWP